ncbi:MAG TPA: cytochrome c3 family protein [Dissulfurispiraceae bacterium]|nr:cytochrome c3 family protein [Dissulfurispiraceae bacterium]
MRLIRRFIWLLVLLCVYFIFWPGGTAISSSILGTKHDLSATGPGPIKALTETRVCVFCHTPHNATPNSPLWNKEIRPQVYTLYTSSTLKAVMAQPTGPTKLCLSCHDGTIALGTVANPAGGITMSGGSQIPQGSLSYFGVDLSSHHPVSFPYGASNPENNPELVPLPLLPSYLELGGTDAEIHCTTCHNPHDNTFGSFLVMDNSYSTLCKTCHQMTGWNVSSHSTIVQGCEVCHTPHFALDVPLLRYTSADYCLSCHSPVPPPPQPPVHGNTVSSSTSTASAAAPLNAAKTTSVSTQIRKWSAHHLQLGTAGSQRQRDMGRYRNASPSVTCTDCHNPHAVNSRKASAANVSGRLQGVSGVDRNGLRVLTARYEYEICFKCHSEYPYNITYISRVVSTSNKRLAFDPSNPSYHPVVSMGRTATVPSIPSPLQPGVSISSIILCTDCHKDDAGGGKGPHGSSYAPILGERYETTDNTPESYQAYALCYRCHNRTSILSDASFQKKIAKTTKTGGGHSGHLATGATCSACHDPHGVTFSGGAGTGDHTHLINFDVRIAAPKPGNRYPVFAQKGFFSGSCTLVCHNVAHNNWSYP